VGKWTTDEDSKLKDAVEKHNGKKWAAVAALVPDRTKVQCMNRWHNALHSKTDDTTARPGKWTKEKDAELKDAVEKHNGKNWAAIAALVPDRTKLQCVNRWNRHNKSDETTGRVGAWATDEDAKLEDAVEKYNGKNWAAISELVPCRTSIQCNKRWHNEKSWHNVLHSKSDEMTARVGTWTPDEDSKLKDAVDNHNGKNWAAIAALVPGRTTKQCWCRWHNATTPRATRRVHPGVNGQQMKTARWQMQ
jgi:hypothetical protein